MTDFLDLNGILIEYTWSGTGPDSNPTIVLLHEGLGSVSLWKSFPEKLAATTGYKVLSFSRQGYGRSTPCAVPRPIHFMHDEGLIFLPQFLKSLGLDNYYLYGHSDGGSIALIFAGGTSAFGLKGMITEAAHVICEKKTVSSIKLAAADFSNADLRNRLKKYHFNNVDCAFEGWKSAWLNPEFINWNIEEYLPEIKVPVLAIQGKEDQYGSSVQINLLKKGMGKNVEVLMLDGCGHSPHFEKTNQVLDAVSKFIGENNPYQPDCD